MCYLGYLGHLGVIWVIWVSGGMSMGDPFWTPFDPWIPGGQTALGHYEDWVGYWVVTSRTWLI